MLEEDSTPSEPRWLEAARHQLLNCQ